MDLFQIQNLLSGLSRSHHQKSASRKPDRPIKNQAIKFELFISYVT